MDTENKQNTITSNAENVDAEIGVKKTLYTQCRCLQELHRETISYYETKLRTYFRSYVALSVILTGGLLALHLADSSLSFNVDYLIPAIYGSIGTFYRNKQNEFALAERGLIIGQLQGILFELGKENMSVPLNSLSEDYKKCTSQFTVFPREIVKMLVARWTEDGITDIPEFIDGKISTRIIENHMKKLNPGFIAIIVDEENI